MDLRTFLRILRKRWVFIAACVVVAVAVAAVLVSRQKPLYQAVAQLFVAARDNTADPNQLAQGSTFTQQRVQSYAEIVNSPQVVEAVREQLGLHDDVNGLAGEISASAPTNTTLINVLVTDASPQRAKAIANSVAEQFSTFAALLETPTGSTTSPVKVSVVRQANLPGAPVSPKKKRDIALGLLLGLIVGVGAAVLRETLDITVKNSDELQERFGVATLGVIGFDAEARRRPLISHSDPHAPRVEAFRRLRTNLQFIEVDATPRSLVITSSVPEEGKTTTAANLAITLAQAGLRVVLVEADLRRPRLGNYLGIETTGVGLTSTLIGQTAVRDATQPWGDGLFDVLPSGPLPPNPSELLDSMAMSDLIRKLEARYDLVLFDAPPLLPVTDAAVLANQASGTLVVVRHGKTSREQLSHALEGLRAVGATVYGVVLNMAPTKGPHAYQGGYAYRYQPETPVAADVTRPARQQAGTASVTRSGRTSG